MESMATPGLYSAGADIVLPTWALGLAGGAVLIFLAGLVSVGLALLLFQPQVKRVKETPRIFSYSVLSLLPVIGALVLEQASAVYTALTDFIQNFFDKLRLILFFGALALAALVLLFLHPQLLTAAYTGIHCFTQPFLEVFVLPLVNTARVFYSLIVAFLNAINTIIFAWTRLPFRVVRACTSLGTITAIVRAVAGAAGDIIIAVTAWLGTGLFTGGRIEFLIPVQELGFTAIEVRAILDCLCRALDPVWDFVIAVPQISALHTTIDCLGNVIPRFVQLILLAVINFEMPRWNNFALELQCTLRGAGDTVEDLVTLALELFYGIYTLIRDLFITQSAAVRGDLTAVSTAAYSVVASTRPLFVDAVTLAAETDLVSFARQWRPLGPRLLNGIDVIITFGFTVLLRLFSSPYSRILTEPACVLVGIANMTLETVFHPIEAFGSSRGIAYFQLGHLGDSLRVAVDAIAQLTIVIDASLPCSFSQILQAIISIPEGVGELFFSFVFHIGYSPWTVGEPSLINCSAVPCDGLPASRPADWSFLDVFPDYYAWNGSRLRRSYVLLLDGGECTAFLLGCETAALNNPNGTTVVDPVCAEAPAACLARSFNRVAVEALNSTLALIFFLPDLVRFNRDYLTTRDLPLLQLEAAFSTLVQCVSNWLDTLDDNEELCETTVQPEGPLQPGDVIPLPPPAAPITPLPPGQSPPPPRSTYDCRADGRAYFFDGRAVLVTLTTLAPPFSDQEQHLRCDPDESRRCAVAGSVGGSVQILGSSPENNVSILIGALPGVPKLQLFMRTNTGNVLVPQTSPINTSALGIATLTNTSCTAPMPLPDPLPENYACRNATVLFVDVYSSANNTRRAGTLLANDSAIACDIAFNNADYVCNTTTNTVHYLGRPVLVRVGTTPPFIDVPLQCDDMALTCLLNILQVIPTVPAVGLLNVSFSLEVFYTASAQSTTLLPVPCERVAPPSYFCNNSRVSMDGFNTVASFDFLALDQPEVYCSANALAAPPACSRIVINYTTPGASAVLEVEGAEVRASINGSRVTVSCQFASARIAASASDPVGPDRTSVEMTTLIAHAERRIAHEMRRTDADPHYSRADLTFVFSRTASVASAATFAGTKLSAALMRISNTTDPLAPLFRKETLLCCFSSVVRFAGVFVVATIFEIVIAVRDVIALPAYPELGYAVPTFAESRDALRGALCKFACALTQILPALPCDSPDLVLRTRCSSSGSCTRNLLCAVFDVPLLLLDYLIDILATLRALAQGQAPGVNANVLGVACAPDNAAGCFVSIITYVVLKAVRVVTTLLRSLLALADCLVCGLIRVVNPGAGCTALLLTIFEPIIRAVEGIAGSVLTLVLNLIVGIIEGIVYLVTGDWQKLFQVVFVKFFENLAQFGRSIFEIIVNLLLAIPGVREIVNFILSIARGACTIIQGLVRIGVPSANFNCGSIPSVKKRGTLTALAGGPGWLPHDPVWDGAAYGACSARMAAFNASDFDARTPAEQYEIIYCQLAAKWVGPNASATAAFDGGSECDTLMPALYAAGSAYNTLDSLTQQRTVICLEGRAATALAHDDGARWLPADLFYNIKQWAPLVFDALIAHDVYAQYSAERSASANVLLSAQYRYTQRVYGGVATVAHLDALAANRSTLTAAAVTASVAARSVTEYAQARLDSVWTYSPTAGSVARVAQIAESVWASVYEGNATFAASLTTGVADYFAARADAAYVSIAPSPDFFGDVAGADAVGVRGLIDALMLDVPSVAVRATRLAAAVHEEYNSSATAGIMSLPAALAQASFGGMLLVTRTLGGGADAAVTWLDTPFVQDYLAAQTSATPVAATNPGAAGIRDPDTRTIIESVSSRVSLAIASLLPAHSPLYAANMAFQHALADLSVSAARGRRLALSRFGARAMLAVSAVASGRASSALNTPSANRVYTSAFAAPVNATNTLPPPLPCQFYIINTTDNSTSYPLCEECTGLDQSLGFTFGAGIALVAYFRPNSTSRVSFRASTDAFNRMRTYLDDRTLPAILGDSPELPARWPWKHFDNWRVLGDDRPNKTRFRGVLPLASLTYNFILDAFGNSGGQGALDSLGGVVASSADKKPFAAAAGRSMNSLVAGAFRTVWRAADFNVSHLVRPVNISALAAADDPASTESILLRANMVRLPESGVIVRISSHSSSSDGTADSASFSAIADIIFAWVNYYRDSVLSCSFGPELDGSSIRFSIGEVVFIVVLAASAIAIVLSLVFPSYLLTILGGVGMLFGVLVLVGVWWLAYEWSYGCLPAMPITSGDDIAYFIVYNLATRCTGGGFVDQDDYNNSNCASCDNWANGRWTIPNFADSPENGGRFGFEDLTYNIVYGFRWLWPAGLAAFMRVGPTLPVFGGLISSDLVQARLQRFGELNFEAMTAVAYSQFMLGFFITAVLNLVVFIVALALASLILGTVLLRLLRLLQSLILIALATIPASILGVMILYDIAKGEDVDPSTTDATDSVEMTQPLLAPRV